MGYRPARALALLGLLGLAACTTARRRVDGDVVRDVAFVGNGNLVTSALESQTDYQLRSQLSVHPAPFGAFTAPLSYLLDLEAFDPDDLVADAYKLEVWYAHHGWFDARVSGWELRRVKAPTRRKAGVVDVTAFLTPGPRSLVRAFDVTGLGAAARAIGKSVERTGYVHAGDEFVLQYVFDTRDLLLEELRNSSYAFASVEVDVDAYPKEQAVDVALVADAGTSCRLGEVRITGNVDVPLEAIRDELGLEEGAPYSVKALRAAQARLFNLKLFSVVTVAPDLSDPTRKDVPIEVKVTETRFRSLRYGGGFDWDGQTFAPRLSASFRHMNVADALWRFELAGNVGFASRQQGGRALVASASASLSRPRLFGTNRLGFVSKADLRRDLLNGQFTYVNPRVDATVTWRLGGSTIATFGPHYEVFEFRPFEGAAKFAAGALFGEGFQNPYSLARFDANVVVDWRDDPLSPNRGRFGALSVRQAVPFDGDDYFYTEVEVDARQYASIANPVVRDDVGKVARGWAQLRSIATPEVVAFRSKTEVLLAWDQRPLPYPERAFLGGATDLRGFRQGQVGAYSCVCLYEPASGRRWDLDRVADGTWDAFRRLLGAEVPPNEVVEPGDPFTGVPGAGLENQPTYLPEGAAFSQLISGEARYRQVAGFPVDGVVFADAGLLGLPARPRDLASAIRLGYGVGARYASPVGPIRLDLTFRPIYPEDWGPKRFVNCQVDDRFPRAFDLLSQPTDGRDLALRGAPFAWNVFIGVGEAF